MKQSYLELGKKIYNMKNPREMRRCAVFLVRSFLHNGKMTDLENFFSQTEILQEIAEAYPFVYEQPQRAFFYNQSTMAERLQLVKDHFSFLTEKFQPETLLTIYRDKSNVSLWEGEPLDGQRFWLMLSFEPGQRKEGLLSVMLRLDSQPLYQIIFWLAPNKQGEMSLWIGAMQGPNMEDARDVVKRVTKHCHTYRTKNLILYAAQAVARALQLKHIYAVTNYGYYANNHVRVDRKLKTDFSEFWKEAGGKETEDKRFDELPLTETRKTMEEVPTRKRAVYRRRFALMDEIDAKIATSMAQLLQEERRP